jgi:hypothetical protein
MLDCQLRIDAPLLIVVARSCVRPLSGTDDEWLGLEYGASTARLPAPSSLLLSGSNTPGTTCSPASLCCVCQPSVPEVDILKPIKAWYIKLVMGLATTVSDIPKSVDGGGEPLSSRLCLCLSGMSLLPSPCQCVLAAMLMCPTRARSPVGHRRVSKHSPGTRSTPTLGTRAAIQMPPAPPAPPTPPAPPELPPDDTLEPNVDMQEPALELPPGLQVGSSSAGPRRALKRSSTTSMVPNVAPAVLEPASWRPKRRAAPEPAPWRSTTGRSTPAQAPPAASGATGTGRDLPTAQELFKNLNTDQASFEAPWPTRCAARWSWLLLLCALPHVPCTLDMRQSTCISHHTICVGDEPPTRSSCATCTTSRMMVRNWQSIWRALLARSHPWLKHGN